MWKRGATAPLGGNRITEDLGNGEQSASHDAQDRLQSCSNRSYQYDPQGRRIEAACGSRITRYQYNGLGEMTKVTTPDGREIEYLYDGSGQRIGKKRDGVQERGWLYQSQLRIAAELDGGNATRASFLHGHSPNVPDGMISESNAEENRLDHRYRLLTDHLGSVGYVVDADTGQIVQQLEYDEWGQVLKDSNPGFQPFGYAGGLYDKDTGLVRFGARDYDPREGRWLTKDPIGLAGGYNLYSYVNGNPISYVDPRGLVSDKIDGDRVQIHKNDADKNWPSDPHGHIYDKNQVVDVDGKVYDKTTKKQVDQLSKGGMEKWKNLLKKAGHGVKCLAPALFVYDWATEGFGPAVDGALWPVSEAWSK